MLSGTAATGDGLAVIADGADEALAGRARRRALRSGVQAKKNAVSEAKENAASPRAACSCPSCRPPVPVTALFSLRRHVRFGSQLRGLEIHPQHLPVMAVEVVEGPHVHEAVILRRHRVATG
jgi:hypothetical protein